ncbi:6-phosphogluconate dehydrogenase [Aquimarina amphilecti]|uniref:6-phosphogluconate dehydrogenase, decarboxylating n=1 Tax=Aquimarina amphilecti TaxID=1038014 RepID=A0A1H7GHW9_AQUAM|nr:NADP-dependent phosphogluconate dehydrogenase [Aquimarina amphilecti]SEK36532.1 6-phosphogluconate dehydrogenase [Aquimarina amphilecti]
MNKGVIYIIYGVSGSGKTTVGRALAGELNIPFFDADDFHPEANIQKMSAGSPLNDIDREPWLQKIATEIINWNTDKGAVLACSALKKKYRKTLESIDKQYVKWIFLDGSFDLIASRLEARENHFFKKTMLTSQFESLEPPENDILIKIDKSIDKIINEIKSTLDTDTSELGLIGLGVMGKSLAKNLLSKDFKLSVYNRHVDQIEVDVAKKFVLEQSDTDTIVGFDDLKKFVDSLAQPRTIMLMVNAGKPVDLVIDELLPYLSEEDCIIDGGNSHYKATLERSKRLAEKRIHFLGTGISGGEEGALKGPSIMPGGSKTAYNRSGKYLEAIAAKDKKKNSCCTYIGPEGSGHFVKMVHNGIEYAEMQLLAETYHILRFYAGKTPVQISNIFNSWINNGLKSYLLEITSDLLLKTEGKDFLIDKILDKAGQKGTGGWSTNAALELGVALPTISESVMARNVSGIKSERIKASEIYQFSTSSNSIDDTSFISDLEKAFLATSIINHHIGFKLLKESSEVYKWQLNLSEIARIWTNGCIIRSNLMEQISSLLLDNNDTSLLLFPEIVKTMKSNINSLSEIVGTGLTAGFSLTVLSAATNYFLTYTSAQSSANIIQAQRDYFGAHTYQRVDKPIDEYFHTNWKN